MLNSLPIALFVKKNFKVYLAILALLLVCFWLPEHAWATNDNDSNQENRLINTLTLEPNSSSEEIELLLIYIGVDLKQCDEDPLLGQNLLLRETVTVSDSSINPNDYYRDFDNHIFVDAAYSNEDHSIIYEYAADNEYLDKSIESIKVTMSNYKSILAGTYSDEDEENREYIEIPEGVTEFKADGGTFVVPSALQEECSNDEDVEDYTESSSSELVEEADIQSSSADIELVAASGTVSSSFVEKESINSSVDKLKEEGKEEDRTPKGHYLLWLALVVGSLPFWFYIYKRYGTKPPSTKSSEDKTTP